MSWVKITIAKHKKTKKTLVTAPPFLITEKIKNSFDKDLKNWDISKELIWD